MPQTTAAADGSEVEASEESNEFDKSSSGDGSVSVDDSLETSAELDFDFDETSPWSEDSHSLGQAEQVRSVGQDTSEEASDEEETEENGQKLYKDLYNRVSKQYFDSVLVGYLVHTSELKQIAEYLLGIFFRIGSPVQKETYKACRKC